MAERLQKILARAGLGSRRGVEELLRRGAVRVNGRVATLGDKADPERDAITVDGKPLPAAGSPLYLLLNKPVGYLTTRHDPFGRPTVFDLLPPLPAKVFPVGRLDLDTEGLLLFTNDGALAQRLAHPGGEVEKEYLAWVEGVPTPAALAALRRGVELPEGRTAGARVRLVEPQGTGALLRLTLREGKKRQVRRMLAAVGHPVRRLLRVRLGTLELGDLGPGETRGLTAEEVRRLGQPAGKAARGANRERMIRHRSERG